MPDVASIPSLSHPWAPLAQQRMFRGLMNAFAYPGRIESLGVAAPDALRFVLAALVDGETSLADPDALVATDDWRRLQARRAVPEEAGFVVARGDRAPAFEPVLGTLESPERGATVILRVARLGEGTAWRIAGPGVDGERRVRVTGLAPAWLAARSRWNATFPMGVDWLLIDEARLVGLPRTTRIEGEA